ncbi:LOW QUALITY PROTEIN: 4-coumarate--CoA ligase 1 [Ixodes scapularis]|uniref:LOW QUALITY PROTEIN: 4-coumarate--CoA ligase 1 n=1 Tax=Ixodes scapularis TaxID=6945 RepID=UPI001A9E3EB4|nr:LOW QUALITY PROTEIN: 4-coumarate--CoA ligase 1 [Ixodes scapularis]
MTARIVNRVIHSTLPDFDVANSYASQFIEQRLKKLSTKIIAVDTHQSLTASQLLEKIRKYAVGYQRHCVKPGSRVCAYVGNAVETVAATFGVVFAGGTLVMAKPAYVARELVYTIEDSQCTFLLTDQENAPNAAKIEIASNIKALFCVGSAPGFIDVLHFQKLSDALFTPHEPVDNKEEVVAILYTSGSVGLPKGVEISHKAYCAAFYSFRSIGTCTEEDVFLCWNPFTHASGFAIGMFCMFFGAKIIITDPLIPYKQFLETLKTHEVSLFIGIPGRMQDIVNEIKTHKEIVSRVRGIIVGGSMTPIPLAREIREIFGVESLFNCYGLTETFGLVSFSLVGQITFDNGVFPAAGVKFKVIDITSGDSLGPHQNGEIAVHARGIMKGYTGRPEATAEALSSDGWFRTGDLGYYDTEGRIHVIERLKQMIKCMDNAVVPAELEELLITHEAVAEAAVVGIPSSKYGEAPTACIVVKDGFEKNLDSVATELKELVAGQAAVFKQLYGGVFFMKSFPKSDNGKILRRDLKTKVAQEIEKLTK